MKGTTGAISRGLLLLSSFDRKEELKAEFERAALPEFSHLYTSAFYLTKNKTEAEGLLSILRNLFINRYQQKKREPEIVDWQRIDQVYESMVDQGKKAERDNPENQLISQFMDEEVERALSELPEEYRTAIVLVDIEELSYEEAAKVMECPIGTVRSRVSRGRRMLQVALRGYALERGLI